MIDRTILLPILNILVAGLTRALHSDLPGSWNVSAKWRAVGLAVLAAASGAFDLVGNGSTWQQAAVSALTTSGSGVALLLVEALFGAKDGTGPTGTGAIDLSHPSKLPAPPRTPTAAMVGLAIGLGMTLGCAAWQKNVTPVLSDAEAYIADAQQAVEVVRALETIFFTAHQDAAAQSKVDRALADVALGIDAAIRALHGATDASQEQFDAAWGAFRDAWAELRTVLADVGIDVPKMGVKRGGQAIASLPAPLAMRGK